MCLGIPGQIVAIRDEASVTAVVDVCGVKREVNAALVCTGAPSDLIGQWVLVHVGFAMSLLDEQEAQATLDALHSMQALGHEVDDFGALNGQAAQKAESAS
ncbi:hydrogenase maturation factor HybG [Plesiomonas shigelloides]|uniref:hydrogenase maturation factor HybG n=1 Tax=Plesiomonas shigelloides TaxID=703 RepID=UPI001261EB10|nr:hydrogenase maturation factor HybG [Plesiomonas shigelloides]KAB7688179.1 hydrogenase maturation factor HybG [Plesiomonas shigelloides]